MSLVTIKLGSVTLSRVSYAEVDLPPETFNLTAADVAAIEWAEPTWANGGQLKAAAAVWIIDDGDARIAVDPAGAADDILRAPDAAAFHQEAFAALLESHGFPRESITHAVGTHLDGIGMWAWRKDDGTWAPFFPNATLRLSQTELDAFDGGWQAPGMEQLAELRAAGTVVADGDGERISPSVTLQRTDGHGPGHQVVRIESEGERAVMVGHLAVVPVQLATGECVGQHYDHAAAWAALVPIRDEGSILIGSLWPEPAAGRWRDGAFVALS